MKVSAFVNSVPTIPAGLSSTGITEPTTTQSTATDGVDRLTFLVPISSLYRIASYLQVNVASDAATTDVGVCRVAYNNGTAVAAANITTAGAAVASFDLKGAAGTSLNQSMTIYCVEGTNIVMTVLDTVTGAKTVGKFDIRFTIEQLA